MSGCLQRCRLLLGLSSLYVFHGLNFGHSNGHFFGCFPPSVVNCGLGSSRLGCRSIFFFLFSCWGGYNFLLVIESIINEKSIFYDYT